MSIEKNRCAPGDDVVRERAMSDEDGNTGGFGSEYKVGPGKPPLHTRFKKGQSGNPKGRPKGAPNMQTLVDEVLGRIVVIRENGDAREVTAAHAVMLKMLEAGLADHHPSRAYILDLIMKTNGPANDDAEQELPSEDDEIIHRALSRKRKTDAARESPMESSSRMRERPGARDD
jgi:hypothetical protein